LSCGHVLTHEIRVHAVEADDHQFRFSRIRRHGRTAARGTGRSDRYCE